jgi:hypothetical protein
MKTKLLIGLAALLLFVRLGFAEIMLFKDRTNTEMGVEGLGAGIFYSVFGSYRLSQGLLFNGGLSYVQMTSGGPLSVIAIPISFSVLVGQTNNFMEIIGGGNFQFASRSATFTNNIQQTLANQIVLPEIGIGWRYWPKFGGLGIRITGYLLIANAAVYPWPGASVAYTF